MVTSIAIGAGSGMLDILRSTWLPVGGVPLLASLRLLAAAALLTGSPALAGEPSWPTATYDYVVVDEDLRDLLQRFGANTGIRIALSDKVQGHVHGRLQSAPPREFLMNVARGFGLDWYYDGTTLWISAASEARTKMLPLDGVKLEALDASLARTKLADARFTLREGPAPGMAVAAGPPRYLAIVEEVLEALVAGRPRPTAQTARAPRIVTIMRGASVSSVEFP